MLWLGVACSIYLVSVLLGGKQCRKYGKINHFSKMCRQVKTYSNNLQKWFVSLNINNRCVSFKIDEGVNVLLRKTYFDLVLDKITSLM